MLTQEMTMELVDGLLQVFGNNIQQIILYGSVARKEETEESDIDIAIILNEQLDLDKKDEFISWVADLDLKYEKVFSIIDIEKKNFDKWKNILPFYRNICREGIVLWKAA